jgi:hypothetical protein
MTVSVTAKSRTISNGTANDGSVVEAEMVELYNNDATLATAINALPVPKAWGSVVGSTGVINASFGVSSVSRTGAGSYTITFSTAFADTNYALTGSVTYGGGSTASVFYVTAKTTTTATVNTYYPAVGLADPTEFSFVALR